MPSGFSAALFALVADSIPTFHLAATAIISGPNQPRLTYVSILLLAWCLCINVRGRFAPLTWKVLWLRAAAVMLTVAFKK